MSRISDNRTPAILPISEPTSEQLVDVLLRFRTQEGLLTEELPMPKELPYGRKVLHAEETYEVILVHLPPYTNTRVHDHGASIGAAVVLEGQLLNALYRISEQGQAEETSAQSVPSGSLFTAERSQIHQMRNPFPERTVSLHVYAPPLQGAKSYE